MDEYSQKQAIEIMNNLKSGAAWLIPIVCTLFLLSFYGEKEIKFFGVSMPRGDAGLFLLTLLCIVELNILRLQAALRTYFLDQKGFEGQEVVIRSIVRHPWALNPWAEFEGQFKSIAGAAGVVSLVLIWGGGAIASLRLLKLENINHTIGFSLFCAYGLLAILISSDIRKMMNIFNSSKSVRIQKAVAGYVTFLALMFVFFQ